MTPRSVAVIGASDDPTRIGGRPLRYLLDCGFGGQVLAVNPKRDTVQGIPALASVAEARATVDLALVAVPAVAAVATLEECAAHGVGAAVVFSSGFAEMGGEGVRGQQAMADIARDSGMRILGPNCLGIFNAAFGLYATFSTTVELEVPCAGPVGVVSQSGAYGAHVAYLARRRGVHVGYLITTGNECDIEAAECIAWMARREEIKVIAACAEGLRDGDALCAALAEAHRQGKPVVFLKMGRSAVGAEAAMSHTASLAGSDAVYDSVFREFGAHRARDTDELLDVAYAASVGVLPADDGVGLMSVSGGMGIQMADAAERNGLALAPMPEHTQERLRRRVPFACARNPIDVTAQVFNDPGLLQENVDAALEEGGYGSLVVFFTYAAAVESMAKTLAEAMTRARERFPDRLIVLSIVAPASSVAFYEAQGCPCFEDPDRAVRAVAALIRIAEALARPLPANGGRCVPAAVPATATDEHQALQLLAAAGLPAPPLAVAADAEAAGEAARALDRFPVAVKVRSAGIAHKSDVGGVRLGLENPAQVRDAVEAVLSAVAAAAPGIDIDGVLIAPMAPPGVDLILGAQLDPLFGPVVVVGLGGVFVEVLEDVSLHRAPVSHDTARAMLGRLRAWPLLTGARGTPPADVDALCRAIVCLSRFAAANRDRLEGVDVNPLRVFAAGEGACMLDALVRWRVTPDDA
jgi:acyl-CoA synthetase (NDP forming)